MIAFKPKGEGRMYSPNRDTNHISAGLVGQAIANAFKARPDLEPGLVKVAEGLGALFNEAKDPGSSVMDVLSKLPDILDSEAGQVFVLSFFPVFMARYATGVRETSKTPDLDEGEMSGLMGTLGALAMVPGDLADQVVKALRGSKLGEVAETPSPFVKVELPPDPTAVDRMAKGVRMVAEQEGVDVEDVLVRLESALDISWCSRLEECEDLLEQWSGLSLDEARDKRRGLG